MRQPQFAVVRGPSRIRVLLDSCGIWTECRQHVCSYADSPRPTPLPPPSPKHRILRMGCAFADAVGGVHGWPGCLQIPRMFIDPCAGRVDGGGPACRWGRSSAVVRYRHARRPAGRHVAKARARPHVVVEYMEKPPCLGPGGCRARQSGQAQFRNPVGGPVFRSQLPRAPFGRPHTLRSGMP